MAAMDRALESERVARCARRSNAARRSARHPRGRRRLRLHPRHQWSLPPSGRPLARVSICRRRSRSPPSAPSSASQSRPKRQSSAGSSLNGSFETRGARCWHFRTRRKRAPARLVRSTHLLALATPLSAGSSGTRGRRSTVSRRIGRLGLGARLVERGGRDPTLAGGRGRGRLRAGHRRRAVPSGNACSAATPSCRPGAPRHHVGPRTIARTRTHELRPRAPGRAEVNITALEDLHLEADVALRAGSRRRRN